jgi:diguanylate cyclase (GGDEF)-like protein/PAS domain S-box-containing protein
LINVTSDAFAINIAFVILAIAMWAHVSIWFSRQLRGYAQLAFGLASGFAAIGSIMLASEVSAGVLIDIRYAPLALAGLFGGALASLVASVMVAAVRLAIGGAGMIDGLVTILFVSALGLVGHRMMKQRQPRMLDVFFLTGGLGLVLTATLALLPTLAARGVLQQVGLEIVSLNCLATFIGGLVLFKTRLTQLERSILESAFAQSPDYIYVKDRESRFLIVNDNMAKLNHADSASKLVGLCDFDLLPRNIAEQRFSSEQDMMRTGTAIVDSFEELEKRFLLASKVPLRDEEGRVVGLAGVTRDITDRNALETELRENKNMLAHAMAGMSDGFAMFDKDGVLIFCNEQYRDAFPLSRDARLPGANIRDIIRRAAETGERNDNPKRPVDQWIEAAASGLHRNKDEDIELYNGDWRSIRTRLADDGTAMVMVSDITSTKQAEAALRVAAEQLRNLADTDGLTGVMNRRAFDEAFMREAARCAREDSPLSVLMIDIDWFKVYNDTYGHPAGDECLRRVSRCLLDSIKRPADTLARYGGEEFVMLLPHTDAAGACAVAERVAASLDALSIVHSGSPLGKVTASAGVATGRGATLRTNHAQLLADADSALYRAKAQGRNRVAEGNDDGNEDDRRVS